MIKVVSNKEQTATGPLPVTLNASQVLPKDYKIYGTTEGIGRKSGSTYKLPIHLQSGDNGKDVTFDVGTTALMADEYIDYKTRMVYKHHDNLIPPLPLGLNTDDFWYGGDIQANGNPSWSLRSGTKVSINLIPVKPSTNYKLVMSITDQYVNPYWSIYAYRANERAIGFIAQYNTRVTDFSFKTPSNCSFVRLCLPMVASSSHHTTEWLMEGTNPTYVPYVPDVKGVPQFLFYEGENTLSCEYTLGESSYITYVGPVEETITKIMRTEDDGQGNVIEHVLYKEGS